MALETPILFAASIPFSIAFRITGSFKAYETVVELLPRDLRTETASGSILSENDPSAFGTYLKVKREIKNFLLSP